MDPMVEGNHSSYNSCVKIPVVMHFNCFLDIFFIRLSLFRIGMIHFLEPDWKNVIGPQHLLGCKSHLFSVSCTASAFLAGFFFLILGKPNLFLTLSRPFWYPYITTTLCWKYLVERGNLHIYVRISYMNTISLSIPPPSQLWKFYRYH